MREVVFAAVMALAAAVAPAQSPVCEGLSASQRELAQRLLAAEFLYECCDDTIARCLAVTPSVPLALRLAENVCRRVAAGQDEQRIHRSLSRRARSMVGGGAAGVIAADDATTAGASFAPVTVTVYACARCPYCSRLVPELHREVTGGALRGSARLAFRTFPIRGHEGSTDAGLAFVAAAAMGHFWEFALHAYSRFDEFAPAAQPQWAAAIGLDPGAFAARQADPTTREALVESKKEGLANGVEETPTVFINGRRWVGDLDAAELVDAIEEEAARVRGELCTAR
jgi:protein-disulfide isomerase